MYKHCEISDLTLQFLLFFLFHLWCRTAFNSKMSPMKFLDTSPGANSIIARAKTYYNLFLLFFLLIKFLCGNCLEEQL